MFIPTKFQQNNPDQLNDIILGYPFANLITQSETGLEANHIPFLLDQSNGINLLQGHIAKANPLWKNLPDQSEALVIFNGPNCYISPNYYPTKKEHGKAVPTWNYVTVHVKGTLSFIHDEKWKLNMLESLTSHHEAGQPQPWSITDAPENYIEKMLSAIVGLEIEVESMTGKWKLSQNQPQKNILGVVEGLSSKTGSDAQNMAELVKTHATDDDAAQ